jgi:hypothetical protein
LKVTEKRLQDQLESLLKSDETNLLKLIAKATGYRGERLARAQMRYVK